MNLKEKIEEATHCLFDYFVLLHDKAMENPVLYVAIVLAIVLAFILWKAILIFVLAVIVFVLALILLLAIIKLKYGSPTLRQLIKKKKILIEEINIAEKKFLKRKIRQETFTQIMEKNHRKMIKLEADIDRLYHRELGENEQERSELERVTARKRHVLKELLERKEKIVKQMSLAKSKYLKRKISKSVYSGLINSLQRDAIEVEAAIQEIHSSEGAKQVMGDLSCTLEKIEQHEKEKMGSEEQRFVDEQLS